MPRYRLHKASGRAVLQFCKLYGREPIYLVGKFDSPESRADYNAKCAEIKAFLEHGKTPIRPPSTLKVRYLTDAFSDWADGYYPKRGKRGEYRNVKSALRPLRPHRNTMIEQFGPLALKEVRQAMIDKGWCRKHVNAQVHRIRRMFRWGVENEMVNVSVYHRLLTVAALRKGEARETPAVRPVSRAAVDAVLPFIGEIVRDMVEIHWLCGVRSDELTGMRTEEIDRSRDVWLHVPGEHKTEHLGKQKITPLGPLAQQRLAKHIDNKPFLFSPRRRQRSRDRYTSETYQHAILAGFNKLALSKGAPRIKNKDFSKPKGVTWRDWLRQYGIEYWHPHQLRHSRATLTCERYGKEGAQAQLGNSPEATDIYALPSLPLAIQIARETG